MKEDEEEEIMQKKLNYMHGYSLNNSSELL